jgi:CubicO group peptidase (beta-lactamase class C family)
MNLFKENKILVSWGVIAIVLTLYSFNQSKPAGKYLLHKQEESKSQLTFNQNQKDGLEKFFNNLYLNHGFNGVVLIGQKDSVFYSGAFGWSDYEKKEPNMLESSFQLASVSKQFTAVAILQLYEKGLLSLTDTIEKFFPDFPHHGITIHHLLIHRSGLPNYHYFLQNLPLESDTSITCQNVVNEITKKGIPLYASVNRRFQYSNTGYAILAAIVEKVSGIPFDQYLGKNIFTPLQMNNSFVYSGKGDPKKTNTTKGYLYRWREAHDNILDKVLGDKGIYCSAVDLFKWDQGLYKNQVINFDTLQKAFQPMGKPIKSKSNYGYGWRMMEWTTDSTKILYHAGWWHGYRSLLVRVQKDSTTIVVLKNRSQGARITAQQILNILYPATIQPSDTLSLALDED